MGTVAITANALLSAFTLLVLVTDGAPTDPVYILYTALVVAIPLLSGYLLVRGLARRDRLGAGRRRTAAIVGNLVLAGASVWAVVDQYPHPEEEGLVAYLLLLGLTPILNVIAFLFAGRRVPAREA